MVSRYSPSIEPRSALKEQLRLFAFEQSPLPSLDVMVRVHEKLSKREKLATLLEGELDFHGANSGYASHDLHAFAAKFPPQLPRAFIRGLTSPGDVVFDPMMGSGTAVVEALLEGRKGIGLDIDPLALRLTRAKTTSVDIDSLRAAGYKLVSKANALLSEGNEVDSALSSRFDEHTSEFINYWFLSSTQRELMALLLAMEEVSDMSARRFLELIFSSIIVTKSGGVSRARDLAHSRPHLDRAKSPKKALEQFLFRLRKCLASIAQLKTDGAQATLLSGDARVMPLADGVIDLIVTSPPYANAIDYMRAHKFSLVWFGEPVKNLSELRSRYVGSERVKSTQCAALPDLPEAIVRKLAERDKNKAAILRKYYSEMAFVFSEMFRVLRNDSAAVVVVGTSVMRDIDVQTHQCLANLAAVIGFDVVGLVQRTLDRNKRMMPARFGKKTDSIIEQRIHEEYVIGLLKPAVLSQGNTRANS